MVELPVVVEEGIGGGHPAVDVLPAGIIGQEAEVVVVASTSAVSVASCDSSWLISAPIVATLLVVPMPTPGSTTLVLDVFISIGEMGASPIGFERSRTISVSMLPLL